MSATEHKAMAPHRVRVFVLTVSDTRTDATDTAGAAIIDVDAIITTGGTGLTSRDSTFEAIDGLLTKRLPGFGELFRMLSYQDIGSAAMMSRACAGTIGKVVVIALPGSEKAVRLAMDKLVVPELAHLVQQAGI